MPGLVQTQAYALALFKEHDRQATADAISGLWAARRSRQDLLKAPAPPHLSMILDEAVIRRPIGGPMVMREQLALLVGLADTPSTVMQVLPFRHGEHPLLGGSLTIFTFSGGTAAAYEESIGTGTLLESSEAVDKRRRDYDRLRAHALPPRMSRGLIKEAMEALSV
ncbi:XRE family transcriptional regulator [Peterkaempfera bronchialis]|uniref:XRE family transcriptional regulator n=1 Tax=Peterkaempfera bronchialis TaxID=2126346 RepID=A0A345T3K1_9ACTN|nr:XRE family transcriptional regulator [Peterkaempfera bronchialis]